MLDLTGNAWQREAARLALWTLERLVNRTDVYGSYLPLERRTPGKSNNYTAPATASSAAWRSNTGHYRRALPWLRPGFADRAARDFARLHVQVVPRRH